MGDFTTIMLMVFYDVNDQENFVMLWETDKIGSKLISMAAQSLQRKVLDELTELKPSTDAEKVVRRTIEAERVVYESIKRFKQKTRPTKLSETDIEAKILEIARSYY